MVPRTVALDDCADAAPASAKKMAVASAWRRQGLRVDGLLMCPCLLVVYCGLDGIQGWALPQERRTTSCTGMTVALGSPARLSRVSASASRAWPPRAAIGTCMVVS